jgi:hypothetical protein
MQKYMASRCQEIGGLSTPTIFYDFSRDRVPETQASTCTPGSFKPGSRCGNDAGGFITPYERLPY